MKWQNQKNGEIPVYIFGNTSTNVILIQTDNTKARLLECDMSYKLIREALGWIFSGTAQKQEVKSTRETPPEVSGCLRGREDIVDLHKLMNYNKLVYSFLPAIQNF